MDDEGAPLSESAQVVDPDVRAHVYSLVTALGGFNGENADRYVLGDDALACLRDIKRWLKLHDEKNNRMDVARCLGEANLVNGDLLPILTLWSTSGQNSKFMSRIALACLELLVPLTWPLELHSEMTVNHHRHTPYLQQAQVLYKRGILGPGGSSLLRTIIRIGLPSMAVPRSDRTTRDEGILKLMLYLLRNIAVISPHSRLSAEGDEEETSRSATINAFQDQDAFALLLTMCSNVADDFNLQDVVLLEILFHIVKGVNVEKLFMNDTQRKAKRTEELGDLLQKESSLRREYAKNAPTRHGRFGTMIWVKRDDAKVSTVSGQDVLKDSQTTLYKMDQSKKWNKPQVRRRQTEVTVNNDFNTPVNLNSTATKNLRIFIEEFLDSGFNPLFTHVRKAIEREADRIMDINSRHYFYTVAWFLEAERVRRKYQRERHSQEDKSLKKMEPDSFALVASVLNQETFVFLNRSMQKSFDNKEVEDLTAEMRCFTQILLTVQEMAQSPLDDDQEVADNIQNRIFYEETTHDRIISIIRGYKDQGFGYLDACTQLAHVFLRMLEHYSKENVDMQIRSRRRIKRKAKQDDQAIDVEDEEHASEDEELMEAERVSKERKFDFKRFAAKFCNQKCVDTFVAFIKYYKELNTDQLKRAHRYFYRIAFKQEMSVLLFRLDIINLFYRMIKGPGALDSSKPIFKEWEELVRQILRRMIKKIDQRPALITELLFSKINSTVFYLEFGFEKQTISVSKRPPAELEVDPREAKTTDEKLSIVVRVMIKDEHINLVKWISEVLRLAADERESWESREQQPGEPTAPNPMIPVKPDDEACQKAMFSNAKLRLLMTLIGFERLGMEDVPGASWVVPSSFTSDNLRHTKRVIDQCLIEPATEDPDQDLSRLIRRKYANDARGGGRDEQNLDIDFGSDSEGEDNVPDGPLFPPNHRSKANALDQLKKQRQKRRKEDGDRETPDDEVLEERRRARLENALARQAKIKSDLYIHASDEESDEEADEEFFRLEEQRRKEQAARIKHALLHGVVEEISDKSSKKTGRKRQSDQHTTLNIDAHTKRQRRKNRTDKLDEGDDLVMAGTEAQSPDSPGLGSSSHDAKGIENTPLTSDEDELEFDDDLAFSRDRNRRKDFTPNVDKMVIEPAQQDADPAAPDEDDDEDAPVVGSSRRRVRGGFVIESDSE